MKRAGARIGFLLVVLLGVFLTHAQDAPNSENHDAESNNPQSAQNNAAPASKSENDVSRSAIKPPTDNNHSTPAEKASNSDSKHTSESNKPGSTANEKPNGNQQPDSAPILPADATTTSPSTNNDMWIVPDSTGNPCIMVSGNITLSGNLMNYEGFTANRTVTLSHKIPATGHCSNLTIRWDWDTEAKNGSSSLQFQFSVDKSTKEVYLSRVDGEVLFFNDSKKLVNGFNNTKLHDFKTPANMSFICGKSIELPLVEEKNRTFTMKLENFRIQAHKQTPSHDFDKSIDGCPTPSSGPDVIPIVVGCALAILVVVVLVAYLINRRRSQAHGYLSM